VDLNRPVEEIFQHVGSRTRKRLRQNLRKDDVRVEEVTERDQLLLWYEILQKTYLNAEVPLADFSLFEAAFDLLHPRGMIKFWLARVQGECAATSVELLYKDIVYGWYGGVDRSYTHYNPNEVLTWHIFTMGGRKWLQSI